MQLSLFDQPPPTPAHLGDPGDTLYRKILTGKIPGCALEEVLDWFLQHPVNLILARTRRTKSGDFRPSSQKRLATITVNHSLNSYAFLITLIHEMAHYEVSVQYRDRLFGLKRRKRIQPHGPEWQSAFRNLITPLLTPKVFPSGILAALTAHIRHPRASTFSDTDLSRSLLVYDTGASGITVEEIPGGGLFATAPGMIFKKGDKLRKRFRCIRIADNRTYLFSPLARVFPFHP